MNIGDRVCVSMLDENYKEFIGQTGTVGARVSVIFDQKIRFCGRYDTYWTVPEDWLEIILLIEVPTLDTYDID